MNRHRARPRPATPILALALCLATVAIHAQEAPVEPSHDAHDMAGMDMGDMDMADAPATDAHAAAMPGMDMSGESMPEMDMSGAYGPYPVTRESSGTAWQPDETSHRGLHAMRGAWSLMAHARFDAVYDRQDGPRGDEDSFLAGMVMGQARRAVGSGDVLQLRAMFSPDPLMGDRGYPLLLASGETADGVHPLVDRQHPHDLVMELSTSYRHSLSATDAVFGYVGLPGEPAFGPPAFMHRPSIMDSPEAPITHHWLDSTHIAFGVVTLGYVHDRWKLEGSRFNGREPDQHRENIETAPLDSSAVRASFNPAPRWSLQASWARLKAPEQLAPDEDQTKWSASALYGRQFDPVRSLAVTAAWGRRSSGHGSFDAWALEAALKPAQGWTVFARAERTENNELLESAGHDAAPHPVSKASLGAVRDFALSDHVTAGLGALYSINRVDSALEPVYGNDPDGRMVFMRIRID